MLNYIFMFMSSHHDW